MTQDSIECVGDLDAGFVSRAATELTRLQQVLSETESQIIELERKRMAVEGLVGHLEGIVSSGRHAEPEVQNRLHVSIRERSPRSVGANEVVEFLNSLGRPAHYKEIYEEFKNRGIAIGGKDPANTLLSRYYNDPRLKRVKRGTYGMRNDE